MDKLQSLMVKHNKALLDFLPKVATDAKVLLNANEIRAKF
jgi:hypothetical protein